MELNEKIFINMEARELRLGNCVEIGLNVNFDAFYSTIEEISNNTNVVLVKDGNTLRCMPLELIKPIPLTEEWLLKLGAIKAYGKIYLSLTNLKAEIHFDIYRDGIVSTIHSSFCELILDEIKFVHQLQNLYFALTGEELTIKQ